MCVSGLCQWAGWTFSFLGFWAGCTNKDECITSSGRGGGRVFGSVPQAPEGRGGGRVGRAGAPDAQPRGPPLDPGPSPNPPAHLRLEAPPRARRSTADTRADWLWQEPIRALRPAHSEPVLHRGAGAHQPQRTTRRRGGEGAGQPGASRRPEVGGVGDL